jgi:hypothetical protein
MSAAYAAQVIALHPAVCTQAWYPAQHGEAE